MSGRCLAVLLIFFSIVLGLFAGSVYLQTNAVDGFHFAVDTMTLRGRIADPADCQLAIPWLFKLTEDIVAVIVFIILGFGLGFYTKTIETQVAKGRFKLERRPAELRIPAPPAARRPQLKTWQEWLRERDPELYEEYYGAAGEESGRLKRWKRWLFDMDRP